MRDFKILAAILFAFSITTGCEEATSDEVENTKIENTTESSDVETDSKEIPAEEEDATQTVEERINEIKELYAQIQSSSNKTNNCKNKAKTTINYDVVEEGIPFENKAKECQLEDGLMYQQIVLNGYEWSETASFYYKDGQRFFTYVSGGAEAYGYDYRVYYDRNGEVIRVLLAENDYDGEEVSAPFEVTEAGRKKEILDAVAYAEKENQALLNGK